ncbi:MAG: alpha-amylase family glycosyl hydrolase, partial [Bacteroidota bacterium]
MYEIFMRSFADSDGDGIGDINGIISKLDYLDELGIEGLWLTPFNKATSYHKYDVEDYYMIDPEYGTMDDFKRLV